MTNAQTDLQEKHTDFKEILEQKHASHDAIFKEISSWNLPNQSFEENTLNECLAESDIFGNDLFKEFTDQLLNGYEEDIKNYYKYSKDIENQAPIDSPIRDNRIPTPSIVGKPDFYSFSENNLREFENFRRGKIKVYFSKKFGLDTFAHWATVEDPGDTLEEICLNIPRVRAYQISDLHEVYIYNFFEDGKYKNKLNPRASAKDYISQEIYFVHDDDNIQAQKQKRNHQLVKDKFFKKNSFEHRMSPCRQCGVTALKSLYYCKNCTLIVHTHCLKAFLESGAQECSGSKKAVRDEKIRNKIHSSSNVSAYESAREDRRNKILDTPSFSGQRKRGGKRELSLDARNSMVFRNSDSPVFHSTSRNTLDTSIESKTSISQSTSVECSPTSCVIDSPKQFTPWDVNNESPVGTKISVIVDNQVFEADGMVTTSTTNSGTIPANSINNSGTIERRDSLTNSLKDDDDQLHDLPVTNFNTPKLDRNITVRNIKNYCMIDKADVTYDPEKIIGEGGFGKVYKADHFGEVALKILRVQNPDQAKIDELYGEVRVLFKLRHNNLVAFRGIIMEDNFFAILTEWCDSKTLEDRLQMEQRRKSSMKHRFMNNDFNGVPQLGALQIREKLHIVRDIAGALDYLHKKRIVHRDIKPANIFLDDVNQVKVGDFGLSCVKRDSQKSVGNRLGVEGTMLWMSPEICGLKTGHPTPYTEMSDVWAYGIVVYQVFTNKTPYAKLNKAGEMVVPQMHQFMWKVATGKLRAEPSDLDNANTPQYIQKLYEHCIRFDKTERWRFKNIYNYLDTNIRQIPVRARSLSDPNMTRDSIKRVREGARLAAMVTGQRSGHLNRTNTGYVRRKK